MTFDASSGGSTGEKGLRFREPGEMAREGITAARMGDYQAGYRLLGEVCDRMRKNGEKVPAPVVSYYGLCLAMCNHRYREAAEFCQAAIDTEPFKADYYANLAEVCAAARLRRKAVAALQRGLAVDAQNARLLQIQADLGSRRDPVIGFLDRSHPLNMALGRIRHALSGAGKDAKDTPGSGKAR